MNCKGGGFFVMRHNNILKTIQNDVEIEPALQEIDNERIDGRIGNEARLDIRARGVWQQGQTALFDIRLKCKRYFSKTSNCRINTEIAQNRKE